MKSPSMQIGYVYPDPPTDKILELQNILIELSEVPAETKKLIGLAGPNEIVQIIADAATWVLVVSVFYGKAFLEQLGKNHANSLPKLTDKISQLAKLLIQKIHELQKAGYEVDLALPVPLPSARNVFVRIDSNKPEDILKLIILMGENAPKIEASIARILDESNNKAIFDNNNSFLDETSNKITIKYSLPNASNQIIEIDISL